uniref:ACT domain-containing protein n=1 Tax=Aegilops tauschii subsp. strangulata TaxID=200361 RepID=A0A453JAJ3_AEGTS
GNLLGIHLFQCPDAVGIVAKLSECIASRGGNIHSVDVFVPDDAPVFYARRYSLTPPPCRAASISHLPFLYPPTTPASLSVSPTPVRRIAHQPLSGITDYAVRSTLTLAFSW